MKKIPGSEFGIQSYEKPHEDLAFVWAAVILPGRKEANCVSCVEVTHFRQLWCVPGLRDKI